MSFLRSRFFDESASGLEDLMNVAPTVCCCYAIDEAYLLPTLLSAAQLRRSLPRTLVDVVIACFGIRTPATDAAAAHCGAQGIGFQLVPQGELEGAPMMCARFLLPRLLDPIYQEIVYFDGDTQISGALETLVSFPLDRGKVLAASDPMALMIDSGQGVWPELRAYFRSIGLTGERLGGYFNSGVLKFRRSDWDAISRECVALCRSGRAFRFPDQDALNLVVGQNRLPMSFRWNFPSFFMHFGIEAMVDPRVYHFMSRPRPWDGPFLPWGQRWHEPYLELAALLPQVSERNRPLRGFRYLKYAAQQRYKRIVEASSWGTAAMRTRISNVEAEAVV
jgi:lipopolysaccharide biosynthesis glycosyltransferase